MEHHTGGTALLLRLWVEAHDPRVRARLLTTDEPEDGTAAIGVDAIVALVEARVRAFEARAAAAREG